MAAAPKNLFRVLPCPIKLLKDLKVTDLKSELEIRGLDTSGLKAVLTDRLQKYLQEQDHDIETFDFNSAEGKIFHVIALMKFCSKNCFRKHHYST